MSVSELYILDGIAGFDPFLLPVGDAMEEELFAGK
jgi:hypothetical protein